MQKYDNRTKQDQSVVWKEFECEAKKVDEDTYDVIGSKEIIDRDGDIVKLENMDTKQYKKNSPIMWAHIHSIPRIGRALKVYTEGITKKTLNFKLKLLPVEANHPEANLVRYSIDNGFGMGWSIGFAPDWKEAELNEKTGGFIFNKSELLELSAVNVGSNPAAFSASKEFVNKAYSDGAINKEGKVFLDNKLDESLKNFLESIIKEPEEETTDKEMEEVIDEIKDELEKDTDTDEEKIEQKIDKDIMCKNCGTKMICPVCDNIEKVEDDSDDLFSWLFKEHQTEKSKDDSRGKPNAEELLNSIIHED